MDEIYFNFGNCDIMYVTIRFRRPRFRFFKDYGNHFNFHDMLGELDAQQIEEFLKARVTGRIACYANGQSYIVPVNYVYDGTSLYGHSSVGKKIEMMRQNPEVCFEVDEIHSIFRWQSVIAWGRFEEITDIDEKQQAMQRIIHRIMPLNTDPDGHPSHGITANESDIGTRVELVVYKIVLSKKTGRFENH